MILTFTMPADRHKLSSSSRRRNLVSSVAPIVPMRVCKNCDKANRPEKCKVGGSSDRCVECARAGYSCDLAPFSPARWARVQRQRDAKLAEWKAAQKETHARMSRLATELEALERVQREMVEGELRNIDEVEADEQSAIPDSNDFLIDVSSEQVEIPADFDWTALVDVGGIVAGGSGSSQGS